MSRTLGLHAAAVVTVVAGILLIVSLSTDEWVKANVRTLLFVTGWFLCTLITLAVQSTFGGKYTMGLSRECSGGSCVRISWDNVCERDDTFRSKVPECAHLNALRAMAVTAVLCASLGAVSQFFNILCASTWDNSWYPGFGLGLCTATFGICAVAIASDYSYWQGGNKAPGFSYALMCVGSGLAIAGSVLFYFSTKRPLPG